MVLRSAAPRDAPTCWVEFTIALATPESRSRTLVSAVLLRAVKARPIPRLMTISCGKTWVQYDVCTPIWVSHNRPKADKEKASGHRDARSDLGQQVRCSPRSDDHAEREGKEGDAGFGC